MPRTGGWLKLIALTTVATVLTVLTVSFLSRNEKAIERAQAAAHELEHQRDSLQGAINERDSSTAKLVLERERLDSVTGRLRDSVNTLESTRAAAQLTVREIRTVGKLQARLRAAFPELGRSGWGLTTIPIDKRDTVGIQYLLVPAWFAETFVIDHANAKSWRAQKDKLLAVDSLRLTVSALQDSVTKLVAANAEAYHTGYDAAFAQSRDLSKRYVAELRKPRIRLGSALGMLGAAGAGLVLGRVSP